MKYICVLLLITVNVVSSYHFYNPESHDVLTKKSLNDVPKGYKLLAAPRNHRRRTRLTRGRRSGSCTDGGFTCNAPFAKSLTSQFECISDGQCPAYYKCCSQKCFLHKICIKASSPLTNNNGRSKCNNGHPGQCERWPYNCITPYSISFTSIFKCDRDSQCPKGFKCCQQNCFVHKICSRAVTIGHSVILQEKFTSTVDYRDEEANTEGNPETTEEGYDEEVTVTTESSTETTEESTTESTTTESTTSSTTEVTTLSTEEEDYDGYDTENETERVNSNKPPLQVTREETDNSVVTLEDATTDVQLTTNRRKVTILNKSFPQRTTPDSNAIDPNYAEYYYHYDNDNKTEENDDDYGEDYEDYE